MAASDETAPVGFELEVFIFTPFSRKTVRDVDWLVVLTTGSAVREECQMFRQAFSLNEQFVEGRVLPVGVVRRHRELNVARELEAAGSN
jgi:hypothetical protein